MDLGSRLILGGFLFLTLGSPCCIAQQTAVQPSQAVAASSDGWQPKGTRASRRDAPRSPDHGQPSNRLTVTGTAAANKSQTQLGSDRSIRTTSQEATSTPPQYSPAPVPSPDQPALADPNAPAAATPLRLVPVPHAGSQSPPVGSAPSESVSVSDCDCCAMDTYCCEVECDVCNERKWLSRILRRLAHRRDEGPQLAFPDRPTETHEHAFHGGHHRSKLTFWRRDPAPFVHECHKCNDQPGLLARLRDRNRQPMMPEESVIMMPDSDCESRPGFVSRLFNPRTTEYDPLRDSSSDHSADCEHPDISPRRRLASHVFGTRTEPTEQRSRMYEPSWQNEPSSARSLGRSLTNVVFPSPREATTVEPARLPPDVKPEPRRPAPPLYARSPMLPPARSTLEPCCDPLPPRTAMPYNPPPEPMVHDVRRSPVPTRPIYETVRAPLAQPAAKPVIQTASYSPPPPPPPRPEPVRRTAPVATSRTRPNRPATNWEPPSRVVCDPAPVYCPVPVPCEPIPVVCIPIEWGLCAY